jgi:hypothetical protein
VTYLDEYVPGLVYGRVGGHGWAAIQAQKGTSYSKGHTVGNSVGNYEMGPQGGLAERCLPVIRT